MLAVVSARAAERKADRHQTDHGGSPEEPFGNPHGHLSAATIFLRGPPCTICPGLETIRRMEAETHYA
ncbi:MAG TPA: hypothetical protein VFY69_01700, partial [Solirubrobacterales bacterium]|nr:hypothetical protein [Solirubrobacterales bacterium]